MKMKQICIPLDNAHDRAAEVVQTLQARGIAICALNLVESKGLGELRLVVSDVPGARQVLMERHVPARVREIVAVVLDNGTNGLAGIWTLLAEANIPVANACPVSALPDGRTVMALAFENADGALAVLAKSGIRPAADLEAAACAAA